MCLYNNLKKSFANADIYLLICFISDDSTRVILSGSSNGDYINASHVHVGQFYFLSLICSLFDYHY